VQLRERHALKKACAWLVRLPIAGDDSENHVLRLFALGLAKAGPARLRAFGRKLDPFIWYQYKGDPVPAMTARLALKSAGFPHASLDDLRLGYRSLLSTSAEATPLLCRLLSIPFTAPSAVELPSVTAMVSFSREEMLETCRGVLLATAAGAIPVETDGAGFLPALALSYARDWDLQTSSALLRCCAYLGVLDAPECRWTVDWLLDQQMADGRFGLLRAEAAHRGANVDDWRGYFERTIYAMWALADLQPGRVLGRFCEI
jgi:hypothetical protein